MKSLILFVSLLLTSFAAALPHHRDITSPSRSGSGSSKSPQSDVPSQGSGRFADDDDEFGTDGSNFQDINVDFSNGSPSSRPVSEPPNAEPVSAPATAPRDCPLSGNGGGSVGGDYPYRGRCNGIDKWGLTACQCTSFVAWKLNTISEIPFTNNYKNARWSNANSWDDAARRAGLVVDNNPTVGSVAQSDAGGYGHVAWVSGVDGDNVQIEEYNFSGVLDYHTRSVKKSKFSYIHF